MENIILIGASGFGRECHNFITMSEFYGIAFTIKGFIDDNPHALDNYEGYAPILNSVAAYQPKEGDVFLCALGNSPVRKKCTEIVLEKGGKFMSWYSPEAAIHPNAKLGAGVVVLPYCNVSANTEVGDFSILHHYCNIGHDARIGNWCSLESYSFMGGYSSLGEGVMLHTRSTILPLKKVGDWATVGAGSVVVRNVKAGTTVSGNPAVRLKW